MKGKQLASAGLAFLLSWASVSPLHALEKAVLRDEVRASETVEFDLFLPQRHRAELNGLLVRLHDPGSAMYRQWLTPAEVQARFGADPARVAAVQRELAALGLTATLTSPHCLHVTGAAAAAESALGTRLRHGVLKSGKAVIVAATPVTLPDASRSLGAVVTGLSGTVRLRSYAKRAALPANRYSPFGDYWFDDLRQAYTWPSDKSYNGKGSTVAVMVDGGFSQPDIDRYFSHEGIASPKVTQINVKGGSAYSSTSDGSLEAELDIEQSGGMAPKAHILLYSLPDLSDDSFLFGLDQVINDNKADVLSMSFGSPEAAYTGDYNDGTDYTDILRLEDDLMAEGNVMGITFVAASGDAGALSIPAPACFFQTAVPCGNFLPSASFPASSPHVTGVGGTNLQTAYDPNSASDLDSTYISEEAFADPLKADIFYGTAAQGGYYGSGGGDSIVFAKPVFQELVNTGASVRTVPDLALHMGGCPADPPYVVCSPDDSGDVEAFAGGLVGVTGTSASAPDFAGLTALNVERQGTRVGNENFYIYALSAVQSAGLPLKVFHRNIPGFNGLYTSGNDGYNRVLGNGTLYGKNFLLAPNVPSAGVPRTPTNK